MDDFDIEIIEARYTENTKLKRRFIIEGVLELKKENFPYERELISINIENDCAVLFVDDDIEKCLPLMRIWGEVSVNSKILTCFINLNVHSEIQENFKKLKEKKNHPFFKFICDKSPFIIGYKDEYPNKIYKGNWNYEEILHWLNSDFEILNLKEEKIKIVKKSEYLNNL